MPLSYGFRGGSEFWSAKHNQPFFIPVPRDKGHDHSGIYYAANKIDPDVRFTEEACMMLTGVPRVFLDVILKGIVDTAKERGVSMIDVEFVKSVEQQRETG